MASERLSETRSAHQATSTPDGEAPGADLQVTIPTDRDHGSVVALVECALVELTHEAVGAVFVSRQVGRSTRTQYVAVDDVGEQFQKRHFDDRLGSSETLLNPTVLRDELIARLSKSTLSVSGKTYTDAGDDLEQFCIVPVHDLRQHQ